MLVYLLNQPAVFRHICLNSQHCSGRGPGTCRLRQETQKKNDFAELCDSLPWNLLHFELLCWQAIMYLSRLYVKPPHNSWQSSMIIVCPCWQRLWIEEAGDAEWKWDTELWIRDGTSAFSNNLAADSCADESSCISVFILTILLSPPPSSLPWPDLFDLSHFLCVDCRVISAVCKPYPVLMHKLDSFWYGYLGVGSMLE